jgi:hypothetical protein
LSNVLLEKEYGNGTRILSDRRVKGIDDNIEFNDHLYESEVAVIQPILK